LTKAVRGLEPFEDNQSGRFLYRPLSQTTCADLHSLNPAILNGAHLLQIWVKPPLCHIVGVAHIGAPQGLFTAYFTYS
jgi:hypothetical protein